MNIVLPSPLTSLVNNTSSLSSSNISILLFILAFYLANKGHKVYAVDYSIEAINFMKSKVKEQQSTLHILHKNIFELEEYYGKFDIFLEYTKYSDEVISWRQKFYSEFNEQKFISLLK